MPGAGDDQHVGDVYKRQVGGLVATLGLAAISLALALPCGVLLALGRISPYRALRWPASAMVYPVSYTHLDVYKRQQNATAASLLAKWTRLNKVVSAAPLIGPMPQMPVNRP